MENEYKRTIMWEYSLDPSILSLSLGTARMHSYMPEVFWLIVIPMTEQIRQIMVSYSFTSEAELFASDMRFTTCDPSIGYRAKNIGMDHDDSMERLRKRTHHLQEKFTEIFQELCLKHLGEDPAAPTNLAVALYLSTYFDAQKSSRMYYAKIKKEKKENPESFANLESFTKNTFGKVIISERVSKF